MLYKNCVPKKEIRNGENADLTIVMLKSWRDQDITYPNRPISKGLGGVVRTNFTKIANNFFEYTNTE